MFWGKKLGFSPPPPPGAYQIKRFGVPPGGGKKFVLTGKGFFFWENCKIKIIPAVIFQQPKIPIILEKKRKSKSPPPGEKLGLNAPLGGVYKRFKSPFNPFLLQKFRTKNLTPVGEGGAFPFSQTLGPKKKN